MPVSEQPNFDYGYRPRFGGGRDRSPRRSYTGMQARVTFVFDRETREIGVFVAQGDAESFEAAKRVIEAKFRDLKVACPSIVMVGEPEQHSHDRREGIDVHTRA